MKRLVFSRPRARHIWLAAGATVCLLLCAEGIARLGFGLGDPPLSVAAPEVEYLLKPGTYRRFGNTININSHHMRSAALPRHKATQDEIRILVLGDSVVNGGALTDQRNLATEIAQSELAKVLNTAVSVGNASAGSWGPGNLLAYVRKFGLFEANVVVIVLNSDDIGDNPTGKPVVGVDPGFPDRRPWLAIEEGWSRYLMPRLQAMMTSGTGVRPDPASADASQAATDRSLSDLKSLVEFIRQQNAPVVMVFSPQRHEAEGATTPGSTAIRAFAAEHALRLVDLSAAFAAAIARGENPYRNGDRIHPNELGQRLLAQGIGEAVLAGLGSQALRPR